MAKLTNISITPSDDGYELALEDDEGEAFDVTATYEQLDLLSEEIDQYLDADEEDELSVDDEESGQEPAEGADDVPPPNPGSPGTGADDDELSTEDEEPSAAGTDPLHEGP